MFGSSFYATGSLSEYEKFVQEEKPVAILRIGTVFHGCDCAVNRICALRDSTVPSARHVIKSETSTLPMGVLQRHLARTLSNVCSLYLRESYIAIQITRNINTESKMCGENRM
jgi:hypothetical protein